MTLKKGRKRKAIKGNIRKIIKSGRTVNEAVDLALKIAGKKKRKGW